LPALALYQLQTNILIVVIFLETFLLLLAYYYAASWHLRFLFELFYFFLMRLLFIGLFYSFHYCFSLITISLIYIMIFWWQLVILLTQFLLLIILPTARIGFDSFGIIWLILDQY
jgi:hypothetical protein